MPVSKHYGGHGEEVASSMKKQYGDRWKEIFYATENKMKDKVSAARKRHSIAKAMSKR